MQLIHEPHFEDGFSHGVEERHTEEAMAVTTTVLQERPERLLIQRSHAVAFYDAKRP